MEETFDNLTHIEKKDNKLVNYILEKLSKTDTQSQEVQELISSLKIAQAEFETAVNNYEFASEPELIDYYTYNIKATQTKYQYLLKKVKEKGL